jgi:hypothetical protein
MACTGTSLVPTYICVCVCVCVFLSRFFTSSADLAVYLSLNSTVCVCLLSRPSVLVTATFYTKTVQQQELKILFQSGNFDRSCFHLYIDSEERS